MRHVKIPAVLSARDAEDLEHLYLDALVREGGEASSASAGGLPEMQNGRRSVLPL
jgi:hypothetical protein